MKLSGAEAVEFESARKIMMASQVCIIASLFLLSILLNIVGIVLAVIAYRKFSALADAHEEYYELMRTLRRAGIVALVMGVLAFGLNVASRIMLYPMIEQLMTEGGLSALLGGSAGSTLAPNANSLWG